MFKKLLMAIVLVMAFSFNSYAAFNDDGILSAAEQDAVARDVQQAMKDSPLIFKADIYPDGVIVVYYDDDNGVADGTCDNAVLFQIGGFATTESGMLVPYVMPLMQIPTCADAEGMRRMYIEEKNSAPGSVVRPMAFNDTGELTPEEYQKLLSFWEQVRKDFSQVIKVYVHELIGVAMVFVDENKDGKPDYVDHLYFSGFFEETPQYLMAERGSVEVAEDMYQNYLEQMKLYRMRHSV